MFLRPAVAIVAAVLFAVGTVSIARAQVGQIGGTTGPSLAPSHAPPAIETNEDLNLRQQPEHSLILDDWLITPSAFVGGIYDTNPGQVSNGAKASEGVRITASGLAERNTGISKTDLYGMGDGRIYTNSSAGGFNIVTADLGGIETYSPVPDWTFNGQADYTHQRDLFNTFGLTHSVTTLNTTGIGLAPSTSPLAYNQFSGVASGEKRFGSAFADLGGAVVSQRYDQSAGSPNNNTVYTATARGGMWLTPDFYGFVAGSGDSRNFKTSIISSNGYRATTGIGTGRIGLMKGEVYVGYQAEQYKSAAIGTAGGLAYGGQLDYTPLPQLDIKLGVDSTIGVALTSAAGNATKVTDVLALASYSIAPEWTASGRAGFIHTGYSGINRTDDAWTMGPTFTYSVWQNFGLTLDYQHIQSTSNAAFASFSRDVVTVGVSYQY